MKEFLSCSVLVGFLAASASANDIRIHFGQPEFVPPITDFVPEAHRPEYAPPGTYTLGIWAQVDFDAAAGAMDDWGGINLSIVSTGDPVTVSDLVMDNFDHATGPGTAFRWESDSDFGDGDNECFLVSTTCYGLGGLWAPEWQMGDGSTDWWSYTTGDVGQPGTQYHYWLGNVTLSCAGNAVVRFNTGPGGISRRGGSSADRVFFGEDDPYPWEPGSPGLPDFVFPEPGTLMLILPGMLLLRRRQS